MQEYIPDEAEAINSLGKSVSEYEIMHTFEDLDRAGQMRLCRVWRGRDHASSAQYHGRVIQNVALMLQQL